MSRYYWAPGYQAGVDAEVFGARYDALRKRHGTVTVETILEEARPDTSPLHKAFEWDDRVAAHGYRLKQAGYLLRGIRVKDEALTDPNALVRYLIAVESDPEADEGPRWRDYMPLALALADPTRRPAVLARALNELAAFQAKYAQLTELAEVYAVIRKVRRRRPPRDPTAS